MSLKLTICFTAFLFITYNSASAQSEEVRFLIDTGIVIIKKNSVNADKVNLDSVKKDALTKAAGITDANRLGPVMRDIYKSINDFHGSFFYKDSTFHWSRDRRVIPDSIMNEWKKGVYLVPRVVDKNIGYLRIPGMGFGPKEEMDKKAQSLNDSLCYLLNKNVKGIILDLRLNGGGAMFPMLLGVEQLLGKGSIGTFHSRTKKSSAWILKDNGYYSDTSLLTSIHPSCNVDARHVPVVILTGTGTGSSGEFFVIAFKGRKKTILLGSQTAGYITSVEGFGINDAAYMYLATGYGADRKGAVYTEALKPDIAMESVDKFNDIGNDEKVKAAIKWLKQHID